MARESYGVNKKQNNLQGRKMKKLDIEYLKYVADNLLKSGEKLFSKIDNDFFNKTKHILKRFSESKQNQKDRINSYKNINPSSSESLTRLDDVSNDSILPTKIEKHINISNHFIETTQKTNISLEKDSIIKRENSPEDDTKSIIQETSKVTDECNPEVLNNAKNVKILYSEDKRKTDDNKIVNTYKFSSLETNNTTNKTTLTPSITEHERIELGNDCEDPYIVQIVTLNTTSIRLKNAILLADKNGTLPFKKLSEFYSCTDENAKVLIDNIQSFGAKTYEELKTLLDSAKKLIEENEKKQNIPSNEELRSLLSSLFNDLLVSEILIDNTVSPRFISAVKYLNYFDNTLGNLLYNYLQIDDVLLSIPGVGKVTKENALHFLSQVCLQRLVELEFSKEEVITSLDVIFTRKHISSNKRENIYYKLKSIKSNDETTIRNKFSNKIPTNKIIENDVLQPRSLSEILKEGLTLLTNREIDIINRRFGFDCEPQTLQDIGSSYNVTREYIRQIEAKGLKKIYQRHKRELELAIYSDGNKIWRQLSLDVGVITENDIEFMKKRLEPNILLAFKVLDLDIRKWLSLFGHKFLGGWVLKTEDLELITEIDSKLKEIENNNLLPCSLHVLSNKYLISDVKKVVKLAGYISYGEYILKDNPQSRMKRALRIHCMLAKCNELSLFDIVSLYKEKYTDDLCTCRDVEIVMQMQRHLFIETIDGYWSALGIAGEVPEIISKPNNIDETSKEIESEQEYESDVDTIGSSIEMELRKSGPLRISELLERAPSFIPKERSINSIGPILLTDKDRFIRPLPGFYALRHQIPENGSELLKLPPAIIFHEDQVKIYTYARHAGEPFGSYPLWLPEIEYLWCKWTRKLSDYKLFQSLLNVIDTSSWPVDIEEKDLWDDLAKHQGSFSIGFDPNTASINLPDLDRIFAACIHLRNSSNISWISANRIIWRRPNDHASSAVLAILIVLEIVEPGMTWQSPHNKRGKNFDNILTKLISERTRSGRLSWNSNTGSDLKRYILEQKDFNAFGWLTKQFVNDLFKSASKSDPTSIEKNENSLDDLIYERIEQMKAEKLRQHAIDLITRSDNDK